MKMLVFVPDGEPRPPKKGEWYQTAAGEIFQADRDYKGSSDVRQIYTRHEVDADDGAHAVLCTIVREWDKTERELRDIREGEYADRCKERDEAEARVKALETHVSELTAANAAAVASRNSMQEALERLASKRDSWEEAIKKLEAELAVLKQGKSAPGGFEELAAWIEYAWRRWKIDGNYSAADLECDLARKIAEIRASLVPPAPEPTKVEIIAHNVAYTARLERLAIFNAHIAGMCAENKQREISGFSPAYTDGDFQSAITKFEREGKDGA